MQWYRLRPTFEIVLDDDREVAMSKLRSACDAVNNPQSFLMHGEYGELHLPTSEHRLWSPHLSFYVTHHRECCMILGRFAPRLDVWTSVWIAYLAMAFTAFFSLILAYSQWMLNERPWGLGIALPAMMVIFLLYAVAHLGQQLSADQMTSLRGRLETILHEADVRVVPALESMPANAGI